MFYALSLGRLFVYVLFSCIFGAEGGYGDASSNFKPYIDACDHLLCAVTEPNVTLSVSAVASGNVGMPLAVPAQVHCAWRCTTVAQCHSFNYRQQAQQCDFYYNPPSACATQQDCYYYARKNYMGKCESPGPVESICSFPFTYDGQLFYGCRSTSPAVSGDIACYQTNRSSVATCDLNPDFQAKLSLVSVTIPNQLAVCINSVYGWIVFQNRVDQSNSWNKSWTEYRNGFGSLGSNYWLGLEKVYQLTSAVPYRIRIEVQNVTGEWFSVEYWSFSIENETNYYRLHASGFSGDTTDAWHYTGEDNIHYHDGMNFTTYDRDNDLSSSKNCAVTRGCGYWFNACYWGCVNCYGSGLFTWRNTTTTSYLVLRASRVLIKPQ